MEALQLALDRKIPVIFSAHRADDINTALRLAKEFNLKIALDLATEGYLMSDAIKSAGVPVIVHPTMQRAAASMETIHSQLANAAFLADKKIPLAIGTRSRVMFPRHAWSVMKPAWRWSTASASTEP